MWKALTFIFALGCIASPIVTEIIRFILDRRRERTEGMGGTQDVAMWGTFIGLGCALGAAICGVAWYLSNQQT